MSRPAIARIRLASLRHNYRLLKQRAGNARVMGVVKADAYGHGLDIIAPALQGEGCTSFAVTDADEGARLRAIIGEKSEIALLSGIFDGEDALLAREYALTPVITAGEQISLLSSCRFTGDVWLKIDTGMNRLGAENPAELAHDCARHGIKVAGIMSHLACADTPSHPLNERQKRRFIEAANRLPPMPASLLNSAGLIALPDCAFDVVRPGIALYGAEPVSNQPFGLQPVMQLCGRIMQVRGVARGEYVSYGADFVAPENMRIAVVSLGYADGLPRALSGCGQAVALIAESSRDAAIIPVVGRICMDYCLLDITRTPAATPGCEVEFWGPRLSAEDVAGQAGTIAYELFTGIGSRVERIAVE